VPGINEKNKSLYELACRIAVNTVAQGTAAELMKLGMILLQKAFDAQQLRARMILQIHDELLIAVPEQHATVVEKIVADALQNSVSWDVPCGPAHPECFCANKDVSKENVPLVVTTRIGSSWDEVTK
jgi:DNA polymerase-1